MPNSIDHYAGYVNLHQVIGQEFDKVILVLDNNFRYNENGELEGGKHILIPIIYLQDYFIKIFIGPGRNCVW